jgi:hypothetical protein
MNRINQRWVIAALLLFAITVTAQTRPDFSGRWTSESEAASPSGGGRGGTSSGNMGSGWGSNITIAQDATRLTVEYAFFARGDMQPPLKFVYALDGSETKNSVMLGRGIQMQTSKAAWEGAKLVITTEHSFENPANGQPMTAKVSQTLSLESPNSLLVETVRSGVLGGPSTTTRTIYKKN